MSGVFLSRFCLRRCYPASERLALVQLDSAGESWTGTVRRAPPSAQGNNPIELPFLIGICRVDHIDRIRAGGGRQQRREGLSMHRCRNVRGERRPHGVWFGDRGQYRDLGIYPRPYDAHYNLPIKPRTINLANIKLATDSLTDARRRPPFAGAANSRQSIRQDHFRGAYNRRRGRLYADFHQLGHRGRPTRFLHR